MTQQEFESEWLDDNYCVVCHTSGSTGAPKEIHLEKSFMKESAGRSISFFGIDSGSRLHTCLDFRYIASKMMTVRAEMAGCRLTSEPPSNTPLVDIGSDEVISLLSVVPSQMIWLLENEGRWNGIRNVLIGGAPIPPLMRRRIATSSYNAWESYGMTETASHIALRKVSDDNVPFRTLPGVSVSVSEDSRLVIHIQGREPLLTTDIAEVLSESEFRILGRADFCVISGGVKIHPDLLESVLGPFIAFDYCISSVPDPKWGERLVLVVETGATDLPDDFLKKAVAVRLNQYKKALDLGVRTPKEIFCVRSLPRTSNGKLDREAVRSILIS